MQRLLSSTTPLVGGPVRSLAPLSRRILCVTGSLSRKCAEEKCIILRRRQRRRNSRTATTTTTTTCSFFPLRLRRNRRERERERERGREGERGWGRGEGKQRKSHLHLFFGVWSGAERRGAARRARVFLMLRDAAPFSFLSFLLFLRLRRPAG